MISAGGPDVLRILLVEDDEDDYILTREMLGDIEDQSFSLEWCQTYEEGFQRMLRNEHDVCLVDYRLGKRNGLDLLRDAVAAGCASAVIFLTGQADQEIDQEAVRAGASDYLVKHRINSDVLDRCIRYAQDRKQAEHALRSERNFVAAVVESAGALVAVVDRRGRLVRFNRACELVSGFTFEEVNGSFFWDVFMPDDFAKDARRSFSAVRSGFTQVDYEQKWMMRDGTWREFAWSHSIIRDVNGNVEHIVGTGVDITERRKAERELQASQAALNSAREREVDIGTRIQQTLLVPQLPNTIKGVQVGARSHASQRIDGDFWDFFIYDRHRFDVLVGDVMGKGVPAALLAAGSKSSFQHAVRRLGLSLREYGRYPEPAEIVGAVHSVVTPELTHLESFVTLCYAGFDLEKQKLELVDGGHTRTIHYRKSLGSCTLLEGHNLPLGVSEWEVYQQVTVHFEPGDVFFFYSDGVTEAREKDGLFGVERLVEMITSLHNEDANTIVDRVCDKIIGLTGGDSLVDDLTCLAIKIAEQQAEKPTSHATMEVMSDPAEINTIRKFVQRFCKENSGLLSEDALHALVLATSEAVSNIVLHSYDGARDRSIQVEAESYLDRICITLCDWGRPFERDGVPSPAFDGSRESGFGLYIIEQCVDEANYYQDELGRNCLALVKLRGETEPGGDETGTED